MMTEMLLLLFRLLRVSLLGPRVFSLIHSKFRGCSYDRLTLFMFSLVNSFLTSLFSVSTLLLKTLLAGGTKTIVPVEAILGEEKSYPNLFNQKQIS